MFEIRELQERDILPIAEAFALIGWNKPVSQYEEYLIEQRENVRHVLVAFENKQFVGHLTIVWESEYPPFERARIPELQDFNVLLKFRRKGIGTLLMNNAEEIVSKRSAFVGIGVGMDADYGAAQRLYVLRGFVPDGRGIVWQNRFAKYGQKVTVDDDLNLYFTKKLR